MKARLSDDETFAKNGEPRFSNLDPRPTQRPFCVVAENRLSGLGTRNLDWESIGW